MVNDHDAHRAAARFHFESELIAQSLLELRPVRIGFRFRLRHELDRKVELSLKAGGVDDGPSGVNPLAEHLSHGCDRHVTGAVRRRAATRITMTAMVPRSAMATSGYHAGLLWEAESEGLAEIHPAHFGILRQLVRASTAKDLTGVDDVGAIRDA